MNLFDVSGKKAIVTGGSRGLGRAMAQGLLEQGCEVVILASNPRTPEIVQEWVKPTWNYHCVMGDLSDPQQREAAFQERDNKRVCQNRHTLFSLLIDNMRF